MSGAPYRILDPRTDSPVLAGSWTDEALVGLHREILLLERLDRAFERLRREGIIRFHLPAAGLAPLQAAPARALEESDWILPGFGEVGPLLARGAPLADCVARWFVASSPGAGALPLRFGDPQRRVLSVGTSLAGSLLQGVGVALGALALGDEPPVVLVSFGVRSARRGAAWAALELASHRGAPVLFLMRSTAEAAPRGLWAAAESLGLPVDLVAGDDPLALVERLTAAASRAREAKTPALVEAVLPSRRRGASMPLRRALEARGIWEAARDREARDEVDGAVREALDRVRPIESGGANGREPAAADVPREGRVAVSRKES